MSIVPYGDSELWLQGLLFLGTGAPLSWAQGPYSSLTGIIALELPEGIGATLAALRVSVLAKDPNTGVLRAVRNAERVYVRQSGGIVSVLSEAEAISAVGLTAATDAEGLVEEGLVGREVRP